MGNQQPSSEKEKAQRLSRKRVHHKRLMVEVVCPSYEGDDIVYALWKHNGVILNYKNNQHSVANW